MKWILRYESLVHWAEEEWTKRTPDADMKFQVLWASDSCSNLLAHRRIRKGRRIKNTTYKGVQQISCPEIVPISEYIIPRRKPVLGESVGAYIFDFEYKHGNDIKKFQVLYASTYYRDDDPSIIAIALVPSQYLEVWVAFEQLCNETVRRPARRQDVYIIGGTNTHFKPTVEWDDVILADDLKEDLRLDMESFFKDGVPIYRELNLAPFRKLLLVGPPGTGKTMLCSMAKLALKKRRVVVYVSGADDEGASFHKIHHALNVVANAGYPVLLIVEEIDAYLRKEDKARILNVLDGLESPNNPKGALMLATTNYPEVIDERIAKRPGRLDRILVIPPIADEDLAIRMLSRYMGPQWKEEHSKVARNLIDQTGAFVREIALHARMLAAHNRQTEVTLEMLEQSVHSLTHQITTGDDLMPRRGMGFGPKSRNGTDGTGLRRTRKIKKKDPEPDLQEAE